MREQLREAKVRTPVKITVGYRGRFGDHADSHMGGIQLKLPL